jgi:hypothetical protein
MFRVLTQFKEREGHLRVPNKHVQLLGTWNRFQRSQKNAWKLVSEKEQYVKNEIGFTWNVLEVQFLDTMITALLAQFKQREGHSCNVSVNHVEHLDGVGSKSNLGFG